MVMFFGFDCFLDVFWCGIEIFYYLKKVLSLKGLNMVVGDEGGFVLDFGSNGEVLELIMLVIEKVGYCLGE